MNTNNKNDMSELTVRGHVRVLLEQDWYTLRELSQEVRMSEKDLLDHLERLRRSAKAGGAVFEVDAPLCLACGFNFTARNRLQRPGRCPQCRSTRISKACYRLV